MKRLLFSLAAGLLASVFVLSTYAVTPGAAQGTGTQTPAAPAVSPSSAPSPSETTGAAPSASTTPGASANCTNIATFAGDVTVPDNTAVTAGETFTKTWRLRNSGTCTWGPGYTFAFVTGNAMATTVSVAVPNTPPGATVDLSIPMKAPMTAGSVRGFWQLRTPDEVSFGPQVWALVRVSGATAPAAAPTVAGGNPPGANCTNNAAFVSDVTIPDNTRIAPGETFTKTWRLRNTGTCTWGNGYHLVFERGTNMTGGTTAAPGTPASPTPGPSSTAAVTIAVPTVPPGATIDLSVSLTAPTTPGRHTSFWRLRNPNGAFFGPDVWVTIDVAAGAPAPTQTPGAVVPPGTLVPIPGGTPTP
jgi:hypothetical protein